MDALPELSPPSPPLSRIGPGSGWVLCAPAAAFSSHLDNRRGCRDAPGQQHRGRGCQRGKKSKLVSGCVRRARGDLGTGSSPSPCPGRTGAVPTCPEEQLPPPIPGRLQDFREEPFPLHAAE